MFSKRTKYTLSTNDITKALLVHLHETSKFYKEQYTYHINYEIKNKFISDVLNDVINEILAKMDNDIYTFKYQIFGEPTFQPSFEFMTKERLKKHMTFTEKINEKDYKNIPFGIRLEFIDTEAFRISYIITIE